MPEVARAPAPHSTPPVLTPSLRSIAQDTRVHCAQLTTMRVNGLGTRKRSQDLHDPRPLRLKMESSDGRACHLRQFDRSHLGLVDRPARPIGGKNRRPLAFNHRWSPSNPSRARSRAGAAHRAEAEQSQGSRDQLAVKAAADEDDGVGAAVIERAWEARIGARSSRFRPPAFSPKRTGTTPSSAITSKRQVNPTIQSSAHTRRGTMPTRCAGQA